MLSTTIYFIRHGETDWNLQQRYQGQKDIPLNTTGTNQAQKIASSLVGKKFSALYSSDLSRAVQTAQEIEKIVNLPITTNPSLREINQGEWEGQYIKDVLTAQGDVVRSIYMNPYTSRKPGGESIGEVAERMYTFLDQLVEKHNQETIIVVSHGLAIATVLCKVRELPLEMAVKNIPENTGIEIINWKRDY
ncbi:MAG TPA: histidine phosphatase family protein [Anaerolineaceae bacterium]|nr:histidine phosphatase family protein [Anaerolineaceae bacterium]